MSFGGERGIRTLDRGLTYTPLAGERLQPLGHLSGESIVAQSAGALSTDLVGHRPILIACLNLRLSCNDGYQIVRPVSEDSCDAHRF
jgi:hypothetical protein